MTREFGPLFAIDDGWLILLASFTGATWVIWSMLPTPPPDDDKKKKAAEGATQQKVNETIQENPVSSPEQVNLEDENKELRKKLEETEKVIEKARSRSRDHMFIAGVFLVIVWLSGR